VNSKSSDQLLELKKQKFISEVKKTANALGVKTPKVIFWEGVCPYDTGHELAHIHIDTKEICVSKRKLIALNFDDLEETAAHEVAHLLEPSHNVQFKINKETAKILSWRPPIAYKIAGTDYEIEKPSRKKKFDITKECNLRSCKKKRQLKKCHICGGYFCKAHLKPLSPNLSNVGREYAFENIEWEKGIGHACPDYPEYLAKNELEEDEVYDRAFDKSSNKQFKEEDKIVRAEFEKAYSLKSRIKKWLNIK
jgi:hypothetical protein